MKIKLDENLPESLVGLLAKLGHDVDTVRQEGIAGADDTRVWEEAQKEGRFLVTQDLDFSDIRHFKPGTHCGLMLVRLPSSGTKALAAQISQVFAVENTASWARCFVVLSEHKLRVQRPENPDHA